MSERPKFQPTDKVYAVQHRKTCMGLPLPVDAKLNAFVEAVEEVGGGRTSRQEVAAAIIAFTAIDGEALNELLHRYRTATVAEVLPETD